MRKLLSIGTALVLIATSTAASAQSNLASQMHGQRDSRINVGVVIPLGSAGTEAERAPRLEAWGEQGRHRNNGVAPLEIDRRDEARPVRLGITLGNQPRMMINGREVPQQDGKQGISTLGWVGIGIVGAVVIFGVVVVIAAPDV